MVASDYAIKVINIKYPNDLNAVQTRKKMADRHNKFYKRCIRIDRFQVVEQRN